MAKRADSVALILAAGKGKRMRSDVPKALQRLNGRYVVDYVIEAAREAGIDRQILVIGHKAQMVRKALAEGKVEFAHQEKQLGTGHAVMIAAPLLEDFDGDLVVLCGDMPLVSPRTINDLVDKRHELDAAAVVLTVVLDDPAAYGRIVRDENGLLDSIVEYRDADEEIRGIREVNTGAFCFDWKELRPVLGRLNDNNDQREYYLTDSVAILKNEGRKVGALVARHSWEGLGINSLDELTAVEQILKNGTG